MGIDSDNVVGDFDYEGFGCLCAICTDLLENPRTIEKCQHSFCKDCLGTLTSNEEFRCPECRCEFTENDIKEPYRLLRNILSKIELKCGFGTCGYKYGYDEYENHKARCPGNTAAKSLCVYCMKKYFIVDESSHKAICVKFMNKKIRDLEKQLEKSKIETERKIIELKMNQIKLKNSQNTASFLRKKIKELENQLTISKSQTVTKSAILKKYETEFPSQTEAFNLKKKIKEQEIELTKNEIVKK